MTRPQHATSPLDNLKQHGKGIKSLAQRPAGLVGIPTVGVTDGGGGTSVSNDTDTAISFTTESFDTHAMWDAGQPTRLTCQEKGFYYITANAFWNGNITGYRRIRVRLNGGATILVGASQDAVGNASIGTDQNAAKSAWEAIVGDYIELIVRQNSGGSLTGFFAVTVYKQSSTP